MTKLKTLKDIDFEDERLEIGHLVENERIYQVLKAEAIKWVKDMREGTSFEPIPMAKEEFIDNGDDVTSIAQNCFKCFFNLTEEDLK